MLHGTGEATDRDIGYGLRKMGLKGGKRHEIRDNKALDEERKTYTREGKKVDGFASSQVPTLEEKTVAEHRPPETQAKGKPILD